MGAVNKHDNNFDLIRLLAAVEVMWVHSVGWMGFPAGPDWLYPFLKLFPGVAVFFVVSGFLITGSLLKPGRSTGAFFLNRILRIYPALWVNIAGLVLMVAAAGQMNWSAPLSRWALTFFATGSDYFAVAWTSSHPFIRDGFYKTLPPSGVLWTIPIELCFYALAPVILAQILLRRGIVWLSLLAWGVVSLAVFFSTDRFGYPDQIMKYLWIFLLGATVRVYWQTLQPIFHGKALIWLSVYITTAAVDHFANGGYFRYWDHDVFSMIMAVLMAGTVISLAYTAPHAANILRGNDISYGLYLWHMPVIWTFVGFGFSGVIPALGAWVLAIGLASLSWFFVERPALALKGRKLAIRHPLLTSRPPECS